MRITIIGSGNVATHMAAAFKNAGHCIVQVYSRDMHKAALLAYHVSAEPIDILENINQDTDLMVIAVKDDTIAEIAAYLAGYEKRLVHTSGAVDLQALLDVTLRAGVLYPLQTLSKSLQVDFRSVPICVEGADGLITNELEQLAFTISNSVYRVDSEKRKTLHLAAVFACNFPNYLYAVAQKLLADDHLSFDLIRPLILETAKRYNITCRPKCKPGAVRNDAHTMTLHQQLLEREPGLKLLYNLISQEIIKNKTAEHGA